MKKIVLIITILTISLIVKAQGNLQFNQIIRTSYSGTVLITPLVVGTITVPVNKVWKIESGSVLETSGLYIRSLSLVVDDQLLFSGIHPLSDGIPYSSPPIWLNAGTYTITIGVGNTSNISIIAKISAIEYNVIP